MPQKRVRAATNDRGVAIAAGAARIEHIFSGRIELILVHAGSSGAHRFHDAESREFRRLANERDLGGALDHPQTIQRGCQIAHYELREALMHESHEMRLARRSAIPRITGRARLSGQQFVATVVAGLHGAERRVQRQGRRAYEVGADKIQGEALQSLHLSDPGEPCHEGRVLHRQNLPLRAFAPRVAMREIQGGRAGATVQQQVGMRRLDPAQIVEIVRLAKHTKAGHPTGALHDSDRLSADRVVDLRPTGGELLGGEVGLIGMLLLSVALRRDRKEDTGGEAP